MNPVGILFALATAFSDTLGNWQVRRLPSISPVLLTWLKFIAGIIAAGVVFFSIGAPLTTSALFFAIVIVAIPVEFLITYWKTQAYQLSPQSIVGPLWGLTALFTIPLGILFLGEYPSLFGYVGVIAIVIGIFILGWHGSMLEIVANLHRERGTIYMLGASAGGAIATVLAKYAFQFGSPIFYLLMTALLTVLATTPNVLSRDLTRQIRGNGLQITALSTTQGLLMIFHFIALSLLPAAYFIALKRMSIVFDVLAGKLSGEEHFLLRLSASIVIFAGILLIVLLG